MHFVYISADKTKAGYVKGCAVDADIAFFEDNRDRRAYCKPYVGEPLNHYVTISENTTVHFRNGETFDYDTVLLPEMCSDPVYTDVVTPRPPVLNLATPLTPARSVDIPIPITMSAPPHTPGRVGDNPGANIYGNRH